jgi:hypothetical protein
VPLCRGQSCLPRAARDPLSGAPEGRAFPRQRACGQISGLDGTSDGLPAELVTVAGALVTGPLAEAELDGLAEPLPVGDGEVDDLVGFGVDGDGFGDVVGFDVDGLVVLGAVDGVRVAPERLVPVGSGDGTVAGGVGSSEVP